MKLSNKEAKKLKKEVTELLNKILIKLKNVPEMELDEDDFEFGAKVKGSEFYREQLEEDLENEENDDAKQEILDKLNALPEVSVIELSCIKDILQTLVKDDGAIRMIEQFYTSNC